MSATTVRSDATFEPSSYRRSIAELFGALGPTRRRDLVERIAVLPRHIHKLASEGLIAVPARR